MNIWHGLTASSMSAFFHWQQELKGSKLEIGIPNKRSVNHWAKRGRARWGIRRRILRFKQKAGAVFFLNFAVPFLGSKSGPKTGSTKLPSNFLADGSLCVCQVCRQGGGVFECG